MTVYTIDRMHCTKVGMVGEVERAAINGFRLADSAATSRLAPVLHAWYQLDFADWPDRIVRNYTARRIRSANLTTGQDVRRITFLWRVYRRVQSHALSALASVYHQKTYQYIFKPTIPDHE
jgi:hypothetical protein